MKVQKMVSLDPATAKIANEMKNFSGWVRVMLMREYEHGDTLDALEYERVRVQRLWACICYELDIEKHSTSLPKWLFETEAKMRGE